MFKLITVSVLQAVMGRSKGLIMSDQPIKLSALPTDVVSQCERFLNDDNVEGSLGVLRDTGYDKSDAIWIMKELQKISFKEATELVHLSNVWKDTREQDDKIQESFIDFLNKIDDKS